MKTRTAYSRASPRFDHYLKVGVLHNLSIDVALPQSVRDEAAAELLRYEDEGIAIQTYSRSEPMNKAAPAKGNPVYAGRGIVYAVVDNREDMRTGGVSTVSIIADAIEEALDNGYETSDDIARYLTTSAFTHEPDKRVRFNSVLKAGDVVGAQMTRKLYNSYNDLAAIADEEEDPNQKALLKAEASGFAAAVSIVLSPFSCEDPKEPWLVVWDVVDKLTARFEKEQRFVRRERNGVPQ